MSSPFLEALPTNTLVDVIYTVDKVRPLPPPTSSSSSGLFGGMFCCFGSKNEDAVGRPPARSPAVKNGGQPLLPTAFPEDQHKKCLVLDLDETLVHSSFKEIPNPDFVIPVEIDGRINRVYVLKRPGVDLFLERVGKQYEIVVFTASLSKYADPLLDLLDVHKVVKHRLFRESCTWHEGNYVKDLQILGRAIEKTIIVDNSPMSYLFQPENAIGCVSYIDDPTDRELFYCLPFLESISHVDNVVHHLPKYSAFIQEQAALAQKQQ